MSYHMQQHSQQKSLGVFIVIAFHILLGWALVTGLKVHIFKSEPPVITVDNIQEKVKPIDQPIPDKPVEPTKKDIIFTQPKEYTFDPDPVTPVDPVDHGEKTTGGNLGTLTISKPQLKNPTKPEYPVASKRLGEEGKTGLRLFITAAGKVADITMVSTSGSSRLDAAAVEHAKSWRFTPCMEGDKPVACWFETRLVWKLENAAR